MVALHWGMFVCVLTSWRHGRLVFPEIGFVLIAAAIKEYLPSRVMSFFRQQPLAHESGRIPDAFS